MMDLSIIIISFNTKKILKDCIESVVKFTKNLDYEIIIVDNDSKDGSPELASKLAKKYPIRLIRNKENVGFGPANNQGIKSAKGRYILFLNSDTFIKKNIFRGMITWLDENPKAGVVTCALRNLDGSLQGTGGYFPNLFKVFAWMFFLEDIPFLDKIIKPFHPMHPHSFYKGESFFKKPHQRDWVTGAFLLTRKEILDDVGVFDEDYFMYTEEVDLCWRIKKKGWQVWFLPKWDITHLGGASSTKEFPILSEFKGVKTFYKKNKPEWQMPIARLFLKGGAFLRILFFGLLKGKEAAVVYAKAFKEA
ncbi:MAG: glycosyltransferase family 2 protein [Patescibacteria group bacterium]